MEGTEKGEKGQASYTFNPIRAGIARKPESYRWCSLGYHVQTHNRDRFLSTDFGLKEFAHKSARARLAFYRRFVYEKGGLMQEVEDRSKAPGEMRYAVTSELHPDGIRNKNGFHGAGKAGLELSGVDRFQYRTRYFTDSGIIGSKEFVSRIYQGFKDHFSSKHDKRPRLVQGLVGVYSLKRLSEAI